jgi:hypothetical protein
VFRNGFIFCNTGFAGEPSGGFLCLNMGSGSMAGYLPGGVGSLILVGSRLIIIMETGDLIVTEAAAQFTEIVRAKRVVPRLCWTAPVLAGGRLYLRGDKGDLICLDVS